MGFIAPTVPADIGNQVVMRAWYQALRKSLDGILVSVKDFGAVGNGSVDDTTAFTKALAYASQNYNCIYVPAGNYKLTSGFELTAAISIFGDGPSLSVLEPHFDAADTYLFKMTAGGSLNVFDIGFDGNDVTDPEPTSNVYLIQVDPTTGTLENLDIHNVKFSNLNSSTGTFSTATIFSNITSTSCIYLNNVNHVSITDCVVDTVSGCFIYAQYVYGIDILNNYIKDVSIYPIHFEARVRDFVISENTLISTSTGTLFGGHIDILEDTTLLLSDYILEFHHHGRIESNHIEGAWAYPAYINCRSVNSVIIKNNQFSKLVRGSYETSVTLAYVINISTRAASDSLYFGPPNQFIVDSNVMEKDRSTGSPYLVAVRVYNEFQSNSAALERRYMTGIHITNNIFGFYRYNQSAKNDYYGLDSAILIDGGNGGIKDVSILNNTCHILNVAKVTIGLSGAIEFRVNYSGVSIDGVRIGGNKLFNHETAQSSHMDGIYIGQYVQNVINTAPNHFSNFYTAVQSVGSGLGNLHYLDNQHIQGATDPYIFATALTSTYHTNLSGNTASRPASGKYLTNYMEYFDTTIGSPIWYNGTNWVDAFGTTAGSYTHGQLLIGNTTTGTLDPATLTAGTNITITNAANSITIANDVTTEVIQDIVGAMFTGNTETGVTVTYDDADGTIDVVVSDLTVAGDSGSTGMTPGDTLTVTGGEGIDTSVVGDTLTIAAEDATSANKGIASFDVTDFTVTAGNVVLNAERIQDIVGAMVTGNTETGITVTYDDTDGTLDFVVSGAVAASGTPANNQIAIWTDASTIEGDSSLTYDGTSFNLATAKNFQIAGSTILADAAGTTTLSNIDALDTTTNETICDAVGAMVTGNTETNITVTYQDADNTLDFVVADATSSTKGAASFDADDFTVASGAVTNNFVGVRAYLATSNQTIGTGSITLVTLNTETYDVGSYFDPTTNYRYTPLVAGKYLVTCRCRWDTGADTASYIIYIFKNGSTYSQHTHKQEVASATSYHLEFLDIVDMNGTTDYIDMRAFQNSGSDRTLSFGSNNTSMTITRLLGS